MRYYPVLLNVADKNCLVIGGGAVGTRKVKTLLKCGATVSVISNDFSESLQLLANQGQITLHKKKYGPSDIADRFLIICATSSISLNKTIAEEANRNDILCNVADNPESSDFILPSLVNRGDLTISISTSGQSPAFAKKLKNDLENMFGEEYALFLALMGAIRKRLLEQKHAPDEHKQLFETLINEGLLELTRNKDVDTINTLLEKTIGKGFLYSDLIQE